MNKSFILVAVMTVLAFSTVPCMCHRWIRSSTEVMNNDDTNYYINQVSTNLLNIFLKNENGNFINSPIGVVELLALALLGANGRTEKELKRTLQVHCSAQSDIYQIIYNNLKQYQNSKFNLNIATAMVVDNNFVESFILQKKKMNWNFSVIKVNDAEKSQLVKKIDSWLQGATKNRSQNFFKDNVRLDKNFKLLLINFATFTGTWSTPFNVQDTKNRPFKSSDNQIRYIPVMYQNINTRYGEFNDFNIKVKFVQLPYKTENPNEKQMSMFVIIPYGDGMFFDIERNIRRITLKRLYQSNFTNVDVYLPKFNLEITKNLADYIKEMGVEDAFTDDNADFSRMHATSPNYKASITEILQTTCIEVNENGSQKGSNINYGGNEEFYKLKNDGTKDFIADRPFIVIIASEDFIFFTAQVKNVGIYRKKLIF